MRIPPEKIEEVRAASDILDVIGLFVRLKKRGKNYVGLCPFHTEKTPSFTVSTEKQMYYCFGCGVGGNVFSFVMEYEKVSFAEAVRLLAEKAAIVIPQPTSDAAEEISELEQIYEVYRTAGRFYYDCLTQTPEGKLALDYFHKRGFSNETIRMFGLGYSPSSWDALINYAQAKNISVEFLEKVGLARKREDGTYYDYFRGRAMFPVFSTSGRVIGFGARKLRENDPLGKYINSPETSIYNKSRILYGLYQSKEAIRECDAVILVEGYVDLITLFQSGVKNVVASSGTALTEEQIQLLGRFTKNITIVYDADSAGSKAAIRGIDLVLENDFDVKVVQLPSGDDPDSFVKKNGGDAFKKLVENSISFVDFIAQTFKQEGRFDSPEGKAKAVRAIVQTIAKMKDELKQNFYIQQVAQKYKLYESTLYRELEKILGEHRRQSRMYGEGIQPQREGFEQPRAEKSHLQTVLELPAAERDLLYAMVEGGESVVKFVFQHLQLEEFTCPQIRSLGHLCWELLQEGEAINPQTLIDRIENEEQKHIIANVVFSKYSLSKGWDEVKVHIEEPNLLKLATDAIRALHRRSLGKLVEENQRLLKEASLCGSDVVPYLERHNELMLQIQQLEAGEFPLSASQAARDDKSG